MATDHSQQLFTTLKRLESEKISLINKVADLEAEQKEYKLVLDVFQTVEPTRRCCRMVGGVLVPRTVAEVKPALETSSKKIEELLVKLNEDLKRTVKQHAELASKLEPLMKNAVMEQAQAEQASSMFSKKGEGCEPAGGGVLI